MFGGGGIFYVQLSPIFSVFLASSGHNLSAGLNAGVLYQRLPLGHAWK